MSIYISLEDHFLSQACRDEDGGRDLNLEAFPEEVRHDFVELGPRRVEKMEQANIAIQVISHTPILGSPSVCQRANDQLAAAIMRYPSRFRGFAMLPMGHPTAIAAEFKRCVLELGFLGALIPNHAEGVYYDGPEYSDLFQTAEELDVPIYLHPSPSPPKKFDQFAGNYPISVQFAISAHAWDWHADCGLHFIRLYAAGIFDRYPRLKIILGHLGEMLPFMIGRVETKLTLSGYIRDLKSTFSEVYARNVWITTSGMLQVAPFVCALRSTSIEHILFSVDYPFEDNVKSVQFMQYLTSLKLMTDQESEMVAHRNAGNLLGIVPHSTVGLSEYEQMRRINHI